MYNFNSVEIQITKEEIYSKISDFDIFKFYCPNFVDFGKLFCSSIRLDNNPSCSIHITNDNILKYKDFSTGEYYDCFNYIMRKYGCNYFEALNIIATDFNIRKIDYKPEELILGVHPKVNKPIYEKIKSRIEIVQQNFNITDYDYWSQYGITLEVLQEYNVFSAKYVYLYKGDKRWIFEYKKTNPCYAYRFSQQDKFSYKIYWPKEEKSRKWLFNGGASSDIEGYDQLPLHGDVLILTKSLKDCMCYHMINLPAISLQGEANKLEPELVEKLKKRFNKIIVNYDNDTQGISSTNALEQRYGFASFYMNEAKDFSDTVKLKGLDEAGLEVCEKITNLI